VVKSGLTTDENVPKFTKRKQKHSVSVDAEQHSQKTMAEHFSYSQP